MSHQNENRVLVSQQPPATPPPSSRSELFRNAHPGPNLQGPYQGKQNLNSAINNNNNVIDNPTTNPSNFGVSLVVNGTSTSTAVNSTKVTSTVNSVNSSTNTKKHNLGFRLRRLFFGSNNPSSPAIAKSKAKGPEMNENKNFTVKHNPSLHSSSSESSSEQKSDPKRKKGQQNAASFANRKSEVNPASYWPPTNSAQNSASLSFLPNQNSYECSICLLEQPIFQFPELKNCHHRACITCLRQYLRIEIYESRVNITCLQCQELMHPNDIKDLLRNDASLVEKYESFMVRRTLITDPDARWCPAPDCDYCVIATGCASCPMLKCERPGCEQLFCYHCKQEWHPNQTCDQARAQRGLNKSVFINSPNPSKANVTFNSHGAGSFLQANASTSVDSFLQRDDIKPCPCCKVLIIKMDDGSCNHMTCSVCGTEFCWLCMQKISDLHYLAPSGCTFWGKKPWSRKKKIMWQLGMLVGAPVGIALIAGIAVPAIIIGIPVWVGRKLYSRFERIHMNRHKSNFLVTTGVLTSIFVSPILAAVAVGIGVPILLAYVYGVVPISLCRSGGCGVTTSTSGVRIELDEDEITGQDGVSVDTALSGRAVTNPSIGEMSLGMSASLSIGSSSHLDRVVLDIQPDRESSSIAACAGSITSNSQAHPHHIGAKHETLADPIPNKRFSLSSQNADSSSVTLSFGERSINTNPSLIDETSLKVHTGSLLEAPANYNPNANQFSPVEVHVIIDDESKEMKPQFAGDSIQESLPSSKRQLDTPVNFLLNKFESRSMEYLSNNYCNICHKSHKPCCPNFQHPLTSKSIKNCKITKPMEQSSQNSSVTVRSKHTSDQQQQKTQKQAENVFEPNNNNIEVNDRQWDLPQTSFRKDSSAKNGNYNISPTMSKKAMSQIFYPSTYENIENGQDVSDNATNARKISKCSLSHSLNFTAYN